MKVNADFTKRVVMHGDEIEWTETRMKGVKRRMLDRLGAEAGRATTIVRYDPNSKFAKHIHTGGEEFIVIEGVFQDEHGDFPVGSYVRNPPKTSHTPSSDEGCMIFVKLWQFDDEDRNDVRIRYDKSEAIPHAKRQGVSVTPLYQDEHEYVRIEKWEPNAEIIVADEGGIEALVLEGDYDESGDEMRRLSWLRVPIGEKIQAKAGSNGAKVWIKSGHLRFV